MSLMKHQLIAERDNKIAPAPRAIQRLDLFWFDYASETNADGNSSLVNPEDRPETLFHLIRIQECDIRIRHCKLDCMPDDWTFRSSLVEHPFKKSRKTAIEVTKHVD